MPNLDWRVAALASGSFLSISYVLCIVGDLLLGHDMFQAWIAFFPGFTWLTWSSFLFGLVEAFLYGVYAALVFVPLYNFFQSRVRQNNAGNCANEQR